MQDLIERQKQSLRLVEQIIELDPDHTTTAYARKMRERLRLPMSAVLEKLWPGETIAYKVDRLGVTRQTFHAWLTGLYRPDEKQSKILARHTGFSASDIRGRLR